jgi:hypothetical protein
MKDRSVNMKKWRLLVAIVIVLAMPLTASACSGGSQTTPQDVKDFTRLDVQNAFDVEVRQSDTFSVEITASEALLDYISVNKTGETLTLKLSPNHPFTDFVLMRKVLKARITMPVLRGVALSGASKATVSGFKSTNVVDLTLAGASTLQLAGVESGEANIDVSGACGLDGKLTTGNVKLDVSGASHVELSGTGKDVKLTGTGASRINLEAFVHRTATITLSGASQATVDAREHLDFSLSGASRLFFLSNPKTGNTEVTGASTVKHK